MNERVYMMVYMAHDLDLMELRLHSLSDVVEKFIIVEYPYGYAGQKCPMYYEENINRFKEFSSKIIHVKDCTEYSSSGLSLFYQRRFSPILMEVLDDCRDEDFIIACDSDVLVKKEALESADLSRQSSLIMNWYLWWWDCITPNSKFTWTISTPCRILRKVGAVAKMVGYNDESGVVTINYAGWHFAKSGGVDKVIENIEGYPHQEYKEDKRLVDPEQIKERMENLWGWTYRKDGDVSGEWKWYIEPYKPENYPKYLNEHPEIFEKYFKEGMNERKRDQ